MSDRNTMSRYVIPVSYADHNISAAHRIRDLAGRPEFSYAVFLNQYKASDSISNFSRIKAVRIESFRTSSVYRAMEHVEPLYAYVFCRPGGIDGDVLRTYIVARTTGQLNDYSVTQTQLSIRLRGCHSALDVEETISATAIGCRVLKRRNRYASPR